MGKKGGKGSKQQEEEAASEAQQDQAASGTKHEGEAEQEGSSDEGEASGPETRSQMLKRHKGEMTAHKKAVQRMGKKSKEDIARLNKEIDDRHAAELAALDAGQTAVQPQHAAAEDGGQVQQAAEAVEDLSLGADRKLSKAQKRREKLEQQEAERQARIAEEKANMGPSNREKEEEQLAKLLQPLKLGMRDIKADGHCLYRSIEDQLSQASPSEPAPTYLELRKQAANYIRGHPDDFLPFIFDEDKSGDPETQLAAYCDELESTAVWGGQLELGALAEVLKCRIEVHAVGMPVVTLGEAYTSRVLRLCYLRHAFGLGEHYNSVELIKS